MLQRAKFIALIIAGVVLAGVASREGSSRAASEANAEVVHSANLFESLKACEVPGVHEHLLATGPKTVAYAGEFTPTRMTPWTTGKVRIFLYIVSGNGVVHIGNMGMTAGPGDFFVIPKGARHAVSVISGTLRAIYFEDRT
jgi:mannose-6-phosphate isomerase-like protein (cupin superfamily)